MQNESFNSHASVLGRHFDIFLLAFGIAMSSAFKLKLYYFSKAVILVHFLVIFRVLGILCRICIAYSIANDLNVNFSIFII